jgi:hypothetical protein
LLHDEFVSSTLKAVCCELKNQINAVKSSPTGAEKYTLKICGGLYETDSE